MRGMLLGVTAIALLLWVLSLAGAPTNPARPVSSHQEPDPPVAADGATGSAHASPAVQAIVGERTPQADDPADDRVRFTAPDGCCCPEVGVRMSDFLRPVHALSRKADLDVIPKSYRSSMREAGIVLTDTCP